MKIALTNFNLIRPPHQSTQEQTLEWLVEAHAVAEKKKQTIEWSKQEFESFKRIIREKLWHVGCKPDVISSRGHVISDFQHLNWQEMEIYRLSEHPEGTGIKHRVDLYDKIVSQVIDEFYVNEDAPPDNIIHVTCTGYYAPSCVQKTISHKNWGEKVTVTHAYHMGCYASLPATRIASSFLKSCSNKVDVIHTELCTLHNNPTQHDAHHLVSHSLFADGFIKYTLMPQDLCHKPCLTLIAMHEVIIPDSTKAMQWSIGESSFDFFLAREIPVLINRALADYFRKLCAKAGFDCEDIRKDALFAIHPGGPKILRYAQETLGLKDSQIEFSKLILKDYGNMSSATLPHIWEKICQADQIVDGTKIVSFAFGPGLTISGAIFEKKG